MPSTVTVLDLDGTTLRCVQSSGPGRITQSWSLPLELAADADRNDGAAVGAAIAKALARRKLRPGSVVMGVPRARAVLRTLLVPVIDRLPELASLVHLQVGRDLPFRMEEAVLDFQVVRRVEVPATDADTAAKADAGSQATAPTVTKLEVLVAAVKQEVVDFYQAVGTAAGCELASLGLLPVANARCVASCSVAEEGSALALVSIRPDEVGVDVVARQALVFSRGASIRGGADAGTPGAPLARDAWVRGVVIDVVRSLHAHGGMESSLPVGRILVAGATGHENDVALALGARLGMPCSVLDPAEALGLPTDAREGAGGALGALGLALGAVEDGGLPFDFLHPKQPAVHKDHRRLWILGGVGAAALLTFALLGARAALVQRRMAVLEAAVSELSDAEKKRPVYRKLVQQTGVIEDWIKGERDWLQQYAYLTSILPPSEEIYVTSLAISGQGSVRMAVQARSGETLARLDRQLRAAGYDVKPLAITPGADRFGYEFRSNVELVPTPRQKIDLHKVKPPARPIDDVSLDPVAYRKGGTP